MKKINMWMKLQICVTAGVVQYKDYFLPKGHKLQA